jgi:hypothetical protein
MSTILRVSTAILVVMTLLVGGVTPVLAADTADLGATSIGVTTVYAGVANTVKVYVNNNTNIAVNGFSVKLEANGTEVATKSGQSILGNLDSNYWGPLAVSFDWTPATAGPYTLNATVSGVAGETNTGNNAFSSAVTVLALSPVTVNVRVEGKDALLWSGPVTFKTSTVTDEGGTTHTINHPTALGALAEAAKPTNGNFSFVVNSSLSYVSQIGNDAADASYNGWLYGVDWQSPLISVIDYTLGNGAQVLFYYGAWNAQLLRLSVDVNNVLYTDKFNISVEQYDGANWNPTPNAIVHADSHIFNTDANGKVLNVSLPPGRFTIFAEKEDYVTFIRSNSVIVSVYVPLSLSPGWNFISFPRKLAAGQDTTSKVFEAVATAGHSIFKYNPAWGWVSLAANTVINPLEGIWIYSAAAIELQPVFDTNPRSVPPTCQLVAGWNAIGYTDFSDSSANSALTSVESNWSTLIGFNAATQSYDISIINNAPDTDAHAETRPLSPWKGYWIFVTADSLLAAISS